LEEEKDSFLSEKSKFTEMFNNSFLLVIDLNHTILSFNFQSQEYIYHLTSKRINIGDPLFDSFSSIFSEHELRFFFNVLNGIHTGKSRNLEVSFLLNDADFWLELYINPLLNAQNEVAQIVIVAHDITEKKLYEQRIVNSLKEKEILLQEVHHRVKNNMQVISSILNIQSTFVKDEKLLEILQESRNRIRAMSIIHEDIYHTSEFGSIDFSDYLRNLSANLISLYSMDDKRIELIFDMENVRLNLDQAVPCGLLVNELVSNAVKHGFTDRNQGEIHIKLKQKGKEIHIEVRDNGIGLDMSEALQDKKTLGLQLVQTLVEQLDAKIQVIIKKGTKFILTFESINPILS
jgi:two-component sensor histidine kinase